MNSQKPETNSLKILQRIAQNDRTAIEDCLDVYGGLIWALAKKYTASIEEAEDAAQKIFLDIWQYAENYDSKKCAEVFFVARIARQHLTEYAKTVKKPTSKGKAIMHKEKRATGGGSELFRDAARGRLGEKKTAEINEALRVLYVEANEDAREMMSHLLKLSAIEITPAKTAAEAWQTAQTEHFDLYLLDSRFPDGDGLELCRRLREYSPHTPIIFYSGDALEISKQKGLAAGANDYLVKPDFDNLASEIFQLTGHAETPTNSNKLSDCISFFECQIKTSESET